MKTSQDRFVTYSHAAHVLGYNIYRSILALNSYQEGGDQWII